MANNHPVFNSSIAAVKKAYSSRFFNDAPILSFVGDQLIREAERRQVQGQGIWPICGLKLTQLRLNTEGYNHFAMYRYITTGWWGESENTQQHANRWGLRPVVAELQLEFLHNDYNEYLNLYKNLLELRESFSFIIDARDIAVHCRVEVDNEYSIGEPEGEGETQQFYRAQLPVRVHTYVGAPVKVTMATSTNVYSSITNDLDKYEVDMDKVVFENKAPLAVIKYSFDKVTDGEGDVVRTLGLAAAAYVDGTSQSENGDANMADEILRAIKIPESNINTTLPEADARKGKFLIFNTINGGVAVSTYSFDEMATMLSDGIAQAGVYASDAEAAALAAQSINSFWVGDNAITAGSQYYGACVVTTSTNPITVSLPNNAPAGTNVSFVQGNTGQITFSTAANPIRHRQGFNKTVGRWSGAVAQVISNSNGSNAEWWIDGDLTV